MEAKFALLDAVIEGIPNMIFIKEADELRFVRFNRAAEELLGFRRDEMIGKNDFDFFPKAEAEHFTSLDRSVLASGQPLDIPVEEIHTRDGDVRYLHTKKIALYDDQGKASYLVGISEDITDRLRLEEERVELLAKERAARVEAAHLTRLHEQEQVQRLEAERINRVKDEFLATLSHELRTPLNAILGWTNLLIDGVVPPQDIPKALATISRNARAEAQLVNDLLDVSGIVTGQFALQKVPVDPVHAVQTALDSVKITAATKQVTIEIALEANPVCILGDSYRLQQVFWNILVNAVKFTPKGGRIQVTAKAHERDFVVTVTDNGVGIHEDFLPLVFERFRQADSSITRKFGGLGLGLAIVRHLMELHGGRVSVASGGKGEGATFTMTLPLAAGAAVSPGEPQREQRPAGVLIGRVLLVVDDDADTRELLMNVLVREGSQVICASSAEEAQAVLASRRVDAMVCDIGMPQKDGLQFMRELRSLGTKGSDVPAVALTAYASESDRRMALEAGFSEHVAKPVRSDDLVLCLTKLIGLRRGL